MIWDNVFDQWIDEDTGDPVEFDGQDAPPPPAGSGAGTTQPNSTNTTAPNRADPAHFYVGQDNRGQIWQTLDSGRRVIEWAVSPGDPSTAVIAGSQKNLGPWSPATAIPAPPGDRNPDDPAHKYLGTDANGDAYQMIRASDGHLLEWRVSVLDDSRNILPGTLRDLGVPANTPPPVIITTSTPPPPPPPPDIPAIVIKNPLADTGGVNLNPNNPGEGAAQKPAKQSDPKHKYVGRDNRAVMGWANQGRLFDVWQIFDGTNVIEWAVPAGEPSGLPIQGSQRNLGPPSALTVAQDDGTAKTPGPGVTDATPAPTTALPGEKSTVLVIAGIAASVLGLFK